MKELIAVLRKEGVVKFKGNGTEIELGPMMPLRSLDDFATTGVEEMMEDDARFDHVGIKLRKMEQ